MLYALFLRGLSRVLVGGGLASRIIYMFLRRTMEGPYTSIGVWGLVYMGSSLN